VAIVDDIVAQLERGGPLKNPFWRAYPYNDVEIVVRQRLYSLRGGSRPLELAARPTLRAPARGGNARYAADNGLGRVGQTS
jgi:hypothetical protein